VLTAAVRRNQARLLLRAAVRASLSRALRRVQRWTLMPYAVVTGCIQPTAILRCVLFVLGYRRWLLTMPAHAVAAAKRSVSSPASATSIGFQRGWCEGSGAVFFSSP
jgi:hypothetical protein